MSIQTQVDIIKLQEQLAELLLRVAALESRRDVLTLKKDNRSV